MSTHIGRRAEDAVAQQLEATGYQVLSRNWRTRWCEIDIVAYRGNTIYFVEVKYRRSDSHGDGLAYITPKKLHKMNFAASVWVAQNQWRGDYELAAVSVDGSRFIIGDIVICG